MSMHWSDFFSNLRNKFMTAIGHPAAVVVTAPLAPVAVAAAPVVAPVVAVPAPAQAPQGEVQMSKGLRGGNVRQDSAYVSEISDADLATFMALKADPAKAREAFLFIIGHNHVGKNGSPVNVSGDMRLDPARYGFADSAAAAAWQASVELAK